MKPTINRARSSRFRSTLALFAMLAVGAAAAQAAPADDTVADEPAANETPTPAPASSPQPPARPQVNSPDEFIPTEEIEEDRPVSYPSDI